MPSYVITADSVPDYDAWGPDEYWAAGDWISWHKALKAKYGPDEANRQFLEAYHRASFGAASYDWRTFDPVFRDYARANGFYEGLFPGVSVVPRLLGSFFDLFRGVSAVGETASEVGQGVSRGLVIASNVLVPLVLAAVGVWLYFRFVRKTS